MGEARYAIQRADEPLEGLDGECWEFHMEVPAELVDALKGATLKQMQEAMDTQGHAGTQRGMARGQHRRGYRQRAGGCRSVRRRQ